MKTLIGFILLGALLSGCGGASCPEVDLSHNATGAIPVTDECGVNSVSNNGTACNLLDGGC